MPFCDYCQGLINKSTDRWILQDDGSYIHIDCIEPALAKYKKSLDTVDFKLLSKIDPREPFIEDWHETCEWCGHITQSPNETHVCEQQV